MTWVLGSAIPFGYGALISDIRVSWPDGTHRDILQKIYPIGPMMMAGFAGSVEMGFAMIYDLQRGHHVEQPAVDDRMMWRPQEAMWRWRRHARRIFGRAPAELQQLGCQLLVVGTSPFPNGGLGLISRCIRMEAPEFLPEHITMSWASIGSGAQHDSARAYARNFISEGGFATLQGETMNPGGAATMTALSVSMSLLREPMASVSPLLQVGRVTATEHLIMNQRAIPAGENHELNIPLARSFGEFVRLCNEQGLNAAAART